jgi:HEAT repeat protein
MMLAPVSDPQAFANKIDCGVVRSVSGRTITLLAAKVEGPPPDADPATKALFDLKSPSDRKRREALTRLKEMQPNPKSQEIIQALQPFVNGNDVFLRGDAFEALAAVATMENVPFLLQALSENKFPHRAAVRALGRIKDERALGALIENLHPSGERNDAIRALINFGPAAEKSLIPRVNDPDAWLSAAVCEVLKETGTPASLPVLEELAAKKDDGLAVPKAIEAVKAIRARNKG